MSDDKEKLAGLVGEDEDDFGDTGNEFADELEDGQEAPKGKSSSENELKKKAHKPLTPRQKLVRVMLRRAGIDEVPELDVIMRGKSGTKMPISSIGLFIGEPEDEVLKEIAKDCKVKNRVNLSARVMKNQVIKIGAQVFASGRMYQPIQVAKLEEDGIPECTSGRHRLAFLAMAYGTDIEIPVYLEEMSINEARDAVVVANQARATKALERAEHAVLQAVSGDADVAQDEMYLKTALTKAKVKKYCVYSVVDRHYPMQLKFRVSQVSSRKDGSLTTVGSMEGFWGSAIDWRKDMERKEFDAKLKASIKFINALVEKFLEDLGFEAHHHMASMTLSAIGKYYQNYGAISGKNAIEIVDKLAPVIVGLGEIGRQKADDTYAAITKSMQA